MATTLQLNPLTGKLDLVLLATSNVQAWMATPSSANLLAALTTKTGTGLSVFGTSPALIGPVTLTIPGNGTGLLASMSGAQTASIVGVNNAITVTGANSVSSTEGVLNQIFHEGSNATLSINGIDNDIERGGSGSTPTLRGIYNNITTYNSATVTDLIGMEFAFSKLNTSAITNAYGVKIGSLSGIGGTINRAIDYDGRFIVDSTGVVTVGKVAVITGAAKFVGTTSGTVTLSVADAAGTWTMKLPTADGTNGQVIQTNGSGQLSFVSSGGGITIGTTTITSGTSGRVLYDNAGVVGEMTTTGSGTVLVLATAPTITGPATITEAVGSSGLTITGATQTSSFPALNVTQTWNASGTTFTGLKVNVTNTASATGSLLADIQVGGTTVFSLTKAGFVTLRNTSGGTVAMSAGSYNSEITFNPAANSSVQGTLYINGNSDCVALKSSGYYGLSADTTNDGNSVQDVILRRKAAASLQMGTNVNGAAPAQAFGSCAGITGTDKTGAPLKIFSGPGTGAGAVSSIIFQTPTVLGSGTTAQSLATRLTIDSAGLTIADTMNVVLNATTGTKIGTATTQKLGFYNVTPVVQQTRGATLTNSVTSGGTDDTIANYTDLVVYATDAAEIRNDIYQLARILRQHDVALRALGLES